MPHLAIPALAAAASAAIPIVIEGGLAALLTTSALTTVVASAAAGALQGALQGRGRSSQPEPSLLVRQSQPIGNFVFGRCRVQRSAVTFIDNVGDDLWLVVPIACHQINSILTLYDGDEVMWTASGGVAEDYSGTLEVYTRLGADDQLAIPELIADFAELDSNFRGQGIAYVALKLLSFASEWGNAPPQLWAEVEGAVVYDPRTSTNVYSANAALCANFYATATRGGPGLTAIDETYLIAAANICDEWVDDQGTFQADGFAVWPSQDNAGTWQHRRYEVNGTFSSDLEAVDILNSLMIYMAGKVTYARGVYRFLAGAYSASVASYTAADLLAPPTVSGALRIEEQIHGVRGSYANPSSLYQPDDFPEFLYSTPAPVGEAPAYLDLDFPAEIHPERASRLAVLTGNERFRMAALALALPVSALAHEAGDTIAFSMPEISIDDEFEIETARISLDPASPGVRIEARQTGTAFWTWNGSAAAVPPGQGVGVVASGRPAPPASVAVTSATYLQADRTVIGALDVQIGASPDFFVTDYLIRWSIGGVDIGSARTGGILRYRIPGFAIGDDVDIEVRAINGMGRRSKTATASATVEDDTAPPAVPTGWVGQAGWDTITLYGNANSEVDFRGFRIYGATASSEALTFLDEIRATRYVRRVPSDDTITRYKVTSIDYAGNESAATGFITVSPTGATLDDLGSDVLDAIQAVEDATTQVASDLTAAETRLDADIANALNEADQRAAQLQGFLADPFLSTETAQTWENWPNQGTLTKVANEEFDIGQSWQLDSTGTQEMGIRMESNRSIWKGDPAPNAIVVEVHFTPNSTTNLQAAGIRALWVYESNTQFIDDEIELADAVASPVVVGQPNIARAVLVHDGTNDPAWVYNYLRVYFESSSDQFAGGQDAQHNQSITVHKIFIRPALEEEIGSGRVLAAIDQRITELRAQIETDTGIDLSADLSQSFLTIADGNSAIAAANTTLKAQIEDPDGSSLGAIVEDDRIARVDGDNALAADIKTVRTRTVTDTLQFAPSADDPNLAADWWTGGVTGEPETMADLSVSDWSIQSSGRIRFTNLQATGGSNGNRIYSSGILVAEEGDVFEARVRLIVSNGSGTATDGFGFRFVWLDDDHNYVGDTFVLKDMVAQGSAQIIESGDVVAPAGSVYLRIGIYARATWPTAPDYMTIRQFKCVNVSRASVLDGKVSSILALDSGIDGTLFGAFKTEIEVDVENAQTTADDAAASVALFGQAVDDLEQNAAAMAGFVVQAGNSVSLLELYALNDPGGTGQPMSVARVDAAQFLIEGSATAESLTITEGWGNLCDNGDFRWGDLRGWTSVPSVWSVVTADVADGDSPAALRESAAPTSSVLKLPADASNRSMNGQTFTCKAGDKFAVTFDYSTGGGTRDVTMRCRIEWFRNNGNSHSFSSTTVDNKSDTTWQTKGPNVVTAPVNGWGRIIFQRHDGGSGAGDGYVTNIRVTKKQDGAVIIEDGTVTADHLNAVSLSAGGIDIHNGIIESSNFVSGSAGLQIDAPAGTMELHSLVARSWVQNGAISDYDLDVAIADHFHAAALNVADLVATFEIDNIDEENGVEFMLSWQCRGRPWNGSNTVRGQVYREYKVNSGDPWTSDDATYWVYNSFADSRDWVSMNYSRREFGEYHKVRYLLYIWLGNVTGGDPIGAKTAQNIRARSQKVTR